LMRALARGMRIVLRVCDMLQVQVEPSMGMTRGCELMIVALCVVRIGLPCVMCSLGCVVLD